MNERVELSAQWRSSMTSSTAGASSASDVEQREQRLEHARLGRRRPPLLALPEAGEDRVEGGAERGRERIEGGVPVAHERPQRGEQRRVGKLVLAELDAVAGEHARAGLARVPDQLVGEPGLADARLTAN